MLLQSMCQSRLGFIMQLEFQRSLSVFIILLSWLYNAVLSLQNHVLSSYISGVIDLIHIFVSNKNLFLHCF